MLALAACERWWVCRYEDTLCGRGYALSVLRLDMEYGVIWNAIMTCLVPGWAKAVPHPSDPGHWAVRIMEGRALPQVCASDTCENRNEVHGSNICGQGRRGGSREAGSNICGKPEKTR